MLPWPARRLEMGGTRRIEEPSKPENHLNHNCMNHINLIYFNIIVWNDWFGLPKTWQKAQKKIVYFFQ